MSELLDFSTAEYIPQEIPVTGPDKKPYLLREASGAAAKRWNNERLGSIIFGPDGKAQRTKDLASLEPLLVSLCLHYNDPEDKRTYGKQVLQTTIESWPHRIQKRLYTEAKRISDLIEADPIHAAIHRVLTREDAPIKLEALREWISNLLEREQDAKEVTAIKPLVEFLKPLPEELAKNGHMDTSAGSD